jgi:hypothetical protein
MSKTVEFIKELERSKIVKIGSHMDAKVVSTVEAVISMSEEEHEEFQKKTPSKGVLVIFCEYQDWKETNL